LTPRPLPPSPPSSPPQAHLDGVLVGAILCKSQLTKGRLRGYVAMFAVDSSVRKLGIGRELAAAALSRMASSCDDIVLETEVTNAAALRLYEGLGFVRGKRLPKYYLNGNDAYRLYCWLS
jgi:N-alpha-acetyltransferase 30